VEEDYVVSLSCDVDIEGDIVLKFYHKQQMSSVGLLSMIGHEKTPLFRCSFHTSFITHHFLDLTLKELDSDDRPIEPNDSRYGIHSSSVYEFHSLENGSTKSHFIISKKKQQSNIQTINKKLSL
jgi:hypothetical protein